MKRALLQGCDLHGVADLLQSADESLGGFLRIGAIEISGTEFAPFGAVAQVHTATGIWPNSLPHKAYCAAAPPH